MEKKLEHNYKRYNNIFIFITLLSLIFTSGFRYGSGSDFFVYWGIYKDAPNIILSEANDVGFIFICKLLNNISKNPQIMFLVTSIIINMLIVNTLRKKSDEYELSIFLYITTFIYYSTFNGVRQWLAASIIFASTEYLLERKTIKYIAMVLVATLIHASAIIMIPVYFIVNNKTFSLRNLLITTIFIMAVFAYIPFVNILFSFLRDTQYAHYFDIMIEAERGVNIIRILVYLAPVSIALMLYKRLNNINNLNFDMILNLCIICCLIMILSVKQVFFARLVFYFEIYYLLLIPKLVKIGNIKLNRLIYYTICILYLAYSYALLITGDSTILPYSINLKIF